MGYGRPDFRYSAAMKDAARSVLEKHSLEFSAHWRLSISRYTLELQEKYQTDRLAFR